MVNTDKKIKIDDFRKGLHVLSFFIILQTDSQCEKYRKIILVLRTTAGQEVR